MPKKERIQTYLSIEYPNDTNAIFNITDCDKKEHDTRYYKYNDIVWKPISNNDIEYFVRDIEEKYTTDNSIKNVTIENKNQSPEEIVDDILNDVIYNFVMKEYFKTMVNTEINISGEQKKIKDEYDLFKNNQIDTAQVNSNDTHFNILRPNIKVF